MIKPLRFIVLWMPHAVAFFSDFVDRYDLCEKRARHRRCAAQVSGCGKTLTGTRTPTVVISGILRSATGRTRRAALQVPGAICLSSQDVLGWRCVT